MRHDVSQYYILLMIVILFTTPKYAGTGEELLGEVKSQQWRFVYSIKIEWTLGSTSKKRRTLAACKVRMHLDPYTLAPNLG